MHWCWQTYRYIPHIRCICVLATDIFEKISVATVATWLKQRESVTHNSNFFGCPLQFELSKFHVTYKARKGRHKITTYKITNHIL